MVWLHAQVEGMQLVIEDLVGSTGLELKVDPGVPYVYAGFAGRPNSAQSGTLVVCIYHRVSQIGSKGLLKFFLGSVVALYLHVPCVTSGRCNVEL